MINIKGLDKADVLIALYNDARVQGMGIIQASARGGLALKKDEAWKLIHECGGYFDYLFGRVMKVNISGDQLEERLYDRDNGPGAALAALQPLLASGN